MVSMTELWLPILLSAVFVFIVSSILHMVIPIHKGDFKKLPGEERILAEMRSQGPQAGSYRFPFAETMKEMGSPEMLEKLKRGPVGILTVLPPGPCNMGKSLVLWFMYSLLVGLLVAHAAAVGLHRGAGFAPVFHLTGAAAIWLALAGWSLIRSPDWGRRRAGLRSADDPTAIPHVRWCVRGSASSRSRL